CPFLDHGARGAGVKILVTGGTGVVGNAAVGELLRRGHAVRLLSRHAEAGSRQWPGDVEPFPADFSHPATLLGCAEGCDAVLHIVGIVSESPPELTYQKINVEGTNRMVVEAERAGVRRLVFVSSLGADRGESDYHRSKHAAEEEVHAFTGSWAVARPGSVYGPGDEVISLLLEMVRSLPAIPVVDSGDQPFQPVWHEDLGTALAELVEREDLAGRTLELAGEETTSMNDLVQRLSTLTGRSPGRVPVPAPLAFAATRFASAAGIDMPVKDAEIQMLVEGNVIEPPAVNALPELLGRAPTPLQEGLRRLAGSLPEQLPSEGVGTAVRKRFGARIEGSPFSPEELFARFRDGWAEIIPLTTRKGPGDAAGIREGATVTILLPGRGNVQVRCDEVTDHSLTLATLEGHPLAGIIHFTVSRDDQALLFEILIYARAADSLDELALSAIGDEMQDGTWRSTAERVVELSEGTAPAGVFSEAEQLDERRAERLDGRVEELVRARRRSRATHGS
ncbi:MAG TPA: NAD-dependent epimerase/dehydratase family protein, partial [Longimicrobiaceae bacterium]|nr:NAD-dependent epimerase/dehydratase family protein [Longimicrobiaceae bacterium]